MTPEDLRPWLRLHHARGIGPLTAHKLLQHFNSIDALMHADADSLDRCAERRHSHRALHSSEQQTRIDGDLHWLSQRTRRHLLPLPHAHYPGALRDCHDAPILLYACGDTEVLNAPAIALVGSRNPSASGRAMARDFAASLAEAGLVIVSGLASGIDAAAHQGALEAGGQSIAVFGTGLAQVYPREHLPLAEALHQQGCLLSEYPPDTPPRAAQFPRRNRIIAGLSLATLVVEASKRSGSLITARVAGDYGREVMAIPGSLHNPVAQGCHHLIKQGAKLVESTADILEEIAPQLRAAMAPAQARAACEAAENEQERQLLAVMDHAPLPLDLLAERCGMDVAEAGATLLMLELRGIVQQSGIGRYSLG